MAGILDDHGSGYHPVVATGGDSDKSFGWGWIFALVIIFLALVFLWGRRGEGNNTSGIAEIAALNALNRHDGGTSGPDARAAFTELNGRFDALSQQVNHINDVNDLRDLKSTQAELNQNVTQQAFNLSTQLAGNRTDTLLSFKDAALQTAQCCCDTLRGQDQLRFEASQNTCNIITNANENTQKILDRMCQDEIARLRDELSRERLAASQFAQNAYLVDRLRPYPQPAFDVFPPIPSGGGYSRAV